MTDLWISWTDEEGNHGSARWAEVCNEEIDRILFDAQRVLGPPHTTV